MLNVLQTIIAHKQEMIANTADFDNLQLSHKSFYQAIKQSDFSFIMECKKASPSKGIIREAFDLDEIVSVYDNYADAISVLTEERFFQGSFKNLALVSSKTNKPVLCKDFILVPKQVRQARYYGADAVLLMLSVLTDEEYMACHSQAAALNMDVLTEVHDEHELQRAIDLGSNIIGINNRNLKNLETSLDTSYQLAQKVPKDRLVISESGINSHQDILRLAAHTDGCLVGSSLMAQESLECAARQLVYGDIKICGVTEQQDADLVNALPFSSLGIIFAKSSKRKISQQLLSIASKKPLVGVFQNQSLDYVLDKAKQFDLSKVQLHGEETEDYISILRKQLPESIKISKSYNGEHFLKISAQTNRQLLDEVLLDSEVGEEKGGTGQVFDWGDLAQIPKSYQPLVRVAGGVGAENIQGLKRLGISKVDICSESELKVGKKCPVKLKEIIQNSKIKARYINE